MTDNEKEQLDCPILLEMEKVLESMLMKGEKISARSMANHLTTIKSYTSVTRNTERKALLGKYQERQKSYEYWKKRSSKSSKDNTLLSLADKESKILELEQQVNILTESHVLMIQAVGELGGYSRWLKFYDDYKEIRDSLPKMDNTSV